MVMASCQKMLSYHTDTDAGTGAGYPYTRLQRMRVMGALLRHRQKYLAIATIVPPPFRSPQPAGLYQKRKVAFQGLYMSLITSLGDGVEVFPFL